MAIHSRLSELDEASMSDAQHEVLSEILRGPRGNLDGPFLAWIHSPQLANHAQRLGAFCRYATGLELRLSELAILVTAVWWKSQAEWQIHAPIAEKAGLSSQTIEALHLEQTPDFIKADEQLIYRFTRALYETRRVDDVLYAEAVAMFGESVVVELVGVLGYYALVAMTLNTFAVRRDSETALPFAEPTPTA